MNSIPTRGKQRCNEKCFQSYLDVFTNQPDPVINSYNASIKMESICVITFLLY